MLRNDVNAAQDGLLYGLGTTEGHTAAQVLRASCKTFTRSEVLISLRAIMASKGGIAEAIVAFEALE